MLRPELLCAINLSASGLPHTFSIAADMCVMHAAMRAGATAEDMQQLQQNGHHADGDAAAADGYADDDMPDEQHAAADDGAADGFAGEDVQVDDLDAQDDAGGGYDDGSEQQQQEQQEYDDGEGGGSNYRVTEADQGEGSEDDYNPTEADMDPGDQDQEDAAMDTENF
jgi:hypothetical protein